MANSLGSFYNKITEYKKGGFLRTKSGYSKFCSACNKETTHRIEDKKCSVCRSLWQRYKITASERRLMEDKQKGLCKICHKSPSKRGLFIDHDHTTGIVRGLLCHNCNIAVGMVRDDPEIITAMIDYLK